ncbi:MAG TPA: hypothetical protein PLD51_00355 [Pontiellaceae bacterium]|nr:hypothetical protein [Pontiellaceae bacterium]HPR82283.1 hypothetical protein [Pontiellaceae bacterium]
MKAPSRTAIILSSLLTGLLLSAVFFWRSETNSRRYAGNNGYFEQKYQLPVKTLRLAQDAVKESFHNNGTGLVEIKNPAPVSAAKEAGLQQAAQPSEFSGPVKLQGISWAQEKPVAMISGRVYQTGDRFGDCTVQEIRTRSILLRDAGGTDIEIKLMEKNP